MFKLIEKYLNKWFRSNEETEEPLPQTEDDKKMALYKRQYNDFINGADNISFYKNTSDRTTYDFDTWLHRKQCDERQEQKFQKLRNERDKAPDEFDRKYRESKKAREERRKENPHEHVPNWKKEEEEEFEQRWHPKVWIETCKARAEERDKAIQAQAKEDRLVKCIAQYAVQKDKELKERFEKYIEELEEKERGE